MDFRLLIVIAPVLIAVSWALFRILPAALNQFQGMLNK
ncbi:MAG: photosystem II protein Y [Thermosynechococcaceae cyanobacterium]